MWLESILAVLGLIGFGRMLLFHSFPIIIAGFILLLILFLTALFVRNRFAWAIFFLTAVVEALYLFLKGFFSITLMLVFVVNLLGVVAVFIRQGKAKQPKVEVIKEEKKRRKKE